MVALALGLLTALFGVMFAAVQTDMKRLLAYSSIENIGIILAGVGLAILFHAYDMNVLAALALAATLYHCLNHALFKSLLFLATGSVMHATSQRSLGKLGGLIRRMPWVAALALIGTLAIAGLPPLNGFVSEWMLFQAFLLTPSLPNSYLNMLVPVATAALALAVALAGYVMVKFYGVVFLGLPREELRAGARRRPWERAGLGWLAVVVRRARACCRCSWSARSIRSRSALVGATLEDSMQQSSWLFLTAIAAASARATARCCSCSGSSGRAASTFLLVRRFYHGRVRRAAPVGLRLPAARTPACRIRRRASASRSSRSSSRSSSIERSPAQPVRRAPAVLRRRSRTASGTGSTCRHQGWPSGCRRWSGVLQHGRIHLYLIYSFATLLVLLLVIQ